MKIRDLILLILVLTSNLFCLAQTENEKKEQIIKIKVSYDDFFFTRTNKTYVMSVEQFAGGRQFKPGDTFPSHIASSMEQIQKDISKLRESFENSIK